MTELTAKVLSEGDRPLEFLLSESTFHRSRSNVVFAETETDNVLPGEVCGMILAGAATSAAKSGGNTGNGVLSALSLGPGAAPGVYQVRMLGETFSAAKTDVGGGKGALTLANPAFGAGAKAGAYRVVITGAATDAGSFIVEDPDGINVGAGTVGVAFTGVVKFTLADGGTDFAVGDVALITLTPAVGAAGLSTFEVTGPAGALDGGTVGTAYEGEVNFSIADGTTNFIVGDGFDITVAPGSGKVVALDLDAVNGAQTATCIAAYGYPTTSGDQDGVAIVRDAEVKKDLLYWPSGITTDEKTAQIALLAAAGIIVR